jgi:hypothetical protein
MRAYAHLGCFTAPALPVFRGTNSALDTRCGAVEHVYWQHRCGKIKDYLRRTPSIMHWSTETAPGRTVRSGPDVRR